MSEQFGVSMGAFSQYFTNWVCLLYKELKRLNPFPYLDAIQRNIPSCFNSSPNLRVKLDCTEFFIERSSSFANQNQPFSHYMHDTTFWNNSLWYNFIVLGGFVGRVSDRQMIVRTYLLDLMEESGGVMAERKNTIKDMLERKGCTLNISPFCSPNQFTTPEVLNTQKIAKFRCISLWRTT